MTSSNLDSASRFCRISSGHELLASAMAGDRNAVDGVLRWIRPFVVRYCRAHVGGGDKAFPSADDVAQEVYLAVVTALPGYRDQGRAFLAFVYGIAAHKVADAHRSAARNRAEPFAEVPEAPDPADGPEAQLMQVESAGRMARLLEMLSGHQREILRLRVLLGLSAEETAEALGSTPGAVRVVQHRALSRLRATLAAETNEFTAYRRTSRHKPAETSLAAQPCNAASTGHREPVRVRRGRSSWPRLQGERQEKAIQPDDQ